VIVADTNLVAFVVAATDLEVPLVTSDRRLLQACPDIAIAPKRFTA
jgi:predicted nucleic acid-binding protein